MASSTPLGFPLCSLHSRSSISTSSVLSPVSSSGAISFSLGLRSPSGIRFYAQPPRRRVIAMATRQLRASIVTKGSWDKLILDSEVPVLVEFYASWCGPCRVVQGIMDEIAEEYNGKIGCFVLNTDDDSEVAEDYEIKAVPAVLLFRNGKECDSVVGIMPKDFYVAAISRAIETS
ncbi:hypothetical protein SAY86_019381 [Trapa natans]|uniref:Thioredoxin domain-containing protein n=1 Tax=Trapa natans TaxID=22666 RepID=A0AAN7LXQ5_TRANT|nr:hypothetical protein SAY86_019381 [Trapa natans]